MLRHNHSRVTIGVAVMISLVLIIVGIGLLRSPESKAAFTNQEMKTMAEILGDALKTRDGQPREFDKLIYLSGLSSSTFDYAEEKMKGTKFTINYALFEIQYPDGNKHKLQNPVYIGESMTNETIRAFEHSTMDVISLKDFKERYQYSIYTSGNQKTNYRLYVLDGQIWLSSYVDNTADKSEIIMHLWKLK